MQQIPLKKTNTLSQFLHQDKRKILSQKDGCRGNKLANDEFYSSPPQTRDSRNRMFAFIIFILDKPIKHLRSRNKPETESPFQQQKRFVNMYLCCVVQGKRSSKKPQYYSSSA